ncbi:transmembrane protein 154 isoform X1 [Sebastes umbrosus]|uniref:transmembrane protein 154 isoform X1 n=1 Tax=Sebastes umbrosus TaxID=72105 RepID=UPI0018A02A84|nr:transmembrane protein 154 isoform X1 [Sebastes umbrosus]
MFASGTGSMRGPRAKTLLLLLLLLLTSLTGTVLCQDEDGEVAETEAPAVEENLEPVDEDNTGISETTPTAIEYTSTLDPSFTGESVENIIEEDRGSGLSQVPGDGQSEPTVDPTGTTEPKPDDGLGIIIILIPVVLVVVIIGMIVCGIFINRRWKNKERNQELRKEDPYLDGSSTEKVPMPMFEEDVPSVLELEMEELGQWMKKDVEPAEDSNHA